jgi:hypothetical protein
MLRIIPVVLSGEKKIHTGWQKLIRHLPTTVGSKCFEKEALQVGFVVMDWLGGLQSGSGFSH